MDDRAKPIPWQWLPAVGAVASLLVWPLAFWHQLPPPWTVPSQDQIDLTNEASLKWLIPESAALAIVCALTAWWVARLAGLHLGLRGWATVCGWTVLGGVGVFIFGLGLGVPLLGVFPLLGLPLLVSSRARAFSLRTLRGYFVWATIAAVAAYAQEALILLDVRGLFTRLNDTGVGWEGPGAATALYLNGTVAAASAGAVFATHTQARQRVPRLLVIGATVLVVGLCVAAVRFLPSSHGAVDGGPFQGQPTAAPKGEPYSSVESDGFVLSSYAPMEGPPVVASRSARGPVGAWKLVPKNCTLEHCMLHSVKQRGHSYVVRGTVYLPGDGAEPASFHFDAHGRLTAYYLGR